MVGAWTISAKPEKATIPIWVDEPWLEMKLAAAVSAACDPARRHVGRAHAARDVDRQDDRGLVGRHAGDHDRPGDRHGQPGEGQREQGEGQVAAHERRAGQGFADQDQAGVADRLGTPPAAAEDVQGDQDRDEGEQEQEQPGHRNSIRAARRASSRQAAQPGQRGQARRARAGASRRRRRAP